MGKSEAGEVNSMRLRKDRLGAGRQVRIRGKRKVMPALLEGGVPHTNYVPKIESKLGEILYRWDILNHLIKFFGYEYYTEMGVCGHDLHGNPADGECFKRIKCRIKTGIDPAFPKSMKATEKLAKRYATHTAEIDGSGVILHPHTSDYYFGHINWGISDEEAEERHERGVEIQQEDLVFIDSSHLPEQAMRDFKNWISENRLSDNATIVFHDAYPNPEYFKSGHIIGGGKGAIWIVVAEICLTMPEWSVWTLALDNGISVVRKQSRLSLPKWDVPLNEVDIFDVPKHAKTLLNLISIDEFRKEFS